jgi:hypothetical protein
MGTIIVFKDISGEQLASLNKPNTPEQERLFKDALNFRVGTTIKFNFGTRYLGYRVVKINSTMANTEAFGQNKPIMKFEFTLELIEDQGESA